MTICGVKCVKNDTLYLYNKILVYLHRNKVLDV